jgi:hypothetical protein
MKNSYLTILILASAILGAHGDTNPSGYIHTNGMNIVVRSPSFAYTNHTTRLLSRSPSLLSARLNTSNRLASAAVSVRSVSHSAIQQIQVASDSARASFGLHKVGFAGSLGGAQPVSITTPDNHPLSFRPTLLAYYDTSSGQTVPLAEVQACGGAVQQPGLVVYANAFSNLDADVQYICTTNSLEQNIVLRQCPPAPDDFGLNPDTTRLEMWTEWFDTSPVRTQQSVITLNGGTNSTNAVTATDTALDFGTMKIVRGRAFNLDGVSNAVPVAKEWGEIQGRKFLLEAVDYRAIQQNLQTLTAAVTPSVKKTYASRGQIIKALSANAVKPDKGRMMQLASADAGQTKGVVLDFTIIDSIPLPEGAIEWWPADGDANDVVGGNNGTMMNGATFGAGEVGQGFSVDGISSFVEIPSSTDPTGPFTIEFWMEADPNNQMDTIQGLIVNDFYGIEISSGWGGNNGANFFISPDGGSTWNMTSTPNGGGAVISSGDWHHIAGTYDGTNMQLYVDGQAWGDSCPSGPPSSTTTGDFLAFGSEDGTWRSDRYFDGILDEVTIYNRALAPSEIAAIYNAGGAGKDRPDCVAPPSNAIGWWAGDGNADDLVSTNNGTLQGGASYGSCEVGQGFVLDGSSGYVNVPDNDLWAFGNNDFTIELWANFANDPSGDEGHPYNGGIFISSDEGGGNANKWFFSAAGDVLNFHINDPVNGPIFLINSAFTPDLNTWYHLAVTRSGDTFTAYVNGVAAGSDTCDRAIPNAAAPLMIGQAEGFYFNGSLDEVTIYNRALSDSEISAIYSAGGAGKCKTMSPFITVQPVNETVLQGSNATFSVMAGGSMPLSYQWYGVNCGQLTGATNATLTFTGVQAGNDDNYYVVVANAFGSVNSSSATLTVLVPPVITEQPTNQVVVQGSNVTFSVMATGTAPLSYQWWFSGTNLLAGATNSAMTLTNVQTTNAGNYYVIATNVAGSVTSSIVTLTVLVPPVITQQPTNQTVIQGGNVTNSVMASGSTPLSYQWWLNGTSLFGSTNAVLILTNVQPTSAGNYWVVVTNVAGGVTSSNALLTVLVPPVITQQPANQTIIQGASVTNGVTVTGSALLSYQWQFNGMSLLGATNALLVFDNVQTTNAGSYSVVITNLAGSVTSSNALLTVLVPPTVILTSPTNGQAFLTNPASIGLSATATDPDGSIATVSFYNGANLLGTTTASPYTFTWTNATTGLYAVTAQAADNWGLVSTSSVATIVVDAPPTVMIISPTNNTLIITPTNLTISATASGSVTQVQFFAGTHLLGAVATTPFNLVWSNVPAGIYNLSAVATDNLGVTGNSGTVLLSVNAITNCLPLADAYVQDGIYTNTNFGTNTALLVLTALGPGTNRDTYFKFGLGGLTNISNAQLSVFGSLNTTSSVPTTVYSVTNTGWGETTITWSNMPAEVAALTTNTVSGTNGAWYLFNVTGYIQAQAAAGSNVVSLAIHDPALHTSLITFNSKENSTNRPSLIITTTNVPPTVSITSPANNAVFTAPASNIIITATATDPDGSIPAVSFYNGTNLLGAMTAPPYSCAWTNVAAGTYVLTAVAADNYGLITTSSVVNVTLTPLLTGMTSWWRAEGNALDSVGTNNGTLQGGITFTNGMVGQCFNFNGTNGFVSTSTMFTNPQNFTLEMWFKTTTTNGGALVGFGDSQATTVTNHDRLLYMDNTGRLHFGIYNSTFYMVDSINSYTNSSWHHVAATASTNSGTCLYVDGVLLTNSAAATNAQNYNGWWRIGGNSLSGWPNVPSSYYFNGLIDEVSLYSRVLSSNEIASIYGAGSAGKAPNLSISLTNPLSNAVMPAGSSINLGVSISDAGGVVTQVQYLVNSLLLGTVTNAPYGMTWTNPPVGTFILTAIACDNNGLWATSSVVNVSVSTNLGPLADSYVQDGSYTNTNFGTNTTLQVQSSSGTGTNRDAYFKFGLGNVTNISGAQLSVYASLSTTNPVATTVYSVTNTGWGETTITWSNKPARVTALTTNTVSGTNGAWYLFNVTGFIQAQVAAGSNVVSLALHDPTNTTSLITINSRENSTNNPSLIITTTNSPPTVNITSPTNNSMYAAPAGNITISATVNDSSGIYLVQFLQGTNSLGAVSTAPYSVTWNNMPPGDYALSAIATDNCGLISTSAVVNVIAAWPVWEEADTNNPGGGILNVWIDSPANGAVIQ